VERWLKREDCIFNYNLNYNLIRFFLERQILFEKKGEVKAGLR
jgi:hypothetical protein